MSDLNQTSVEQEEAVDASVSTTTVNPTEQRVAISKSLVKSSLEQGYSKEEIRTTHYPQINSNQWTKAVKMMGLNSVRPKKLTFTIVEE